MGVAMAESTFAENLLRLRKAAGLSQMELASRAGLTVSSVSQLEQGKIRDPRMSTVIVIANALGVSKDDLLEGVSLEPRRARKRQGEG